MFVQLFRIYYCQYHWYLRRCGDEKEGGRDYSHEWYYRVIWGRKWWKFIVTSFKIVILEEFLSIVVQNIGKKFAYCRIFAYFCTQQIAL